MEDPYQKFARLVEQEKEKITSTKAAEALKSDTEMSSLYQHMLAVREQERLRQLEVDARSEPLTIAQFTADALSRHGVRKKEWVNEEPELERKGFGLWRRDVFRQRITRYAFDGWNAGTIYLQSRGRSEELVLSDDGALSIVSQHSYLSEASKQAADNPLNAKLHHGIGSDQFRHSEWSSDPVDSSLDPEVELTLRRNFAYEDLKAEHDKILQDAKVSAKDDDSGIFEPDAVQRARRAGRMAEIELFRDATFETLSHIDIEPRLQGMLAALLARHEY